MAGAMRTERARRSLAERLRERRGEIEEGVLTRVNAIADSSATADPSYVEGLRGAVAAAIDYGIAAVEQEGDREPPVPVALLAQARSAARNGVSLDTVLRRYFAGYSLLGYHLVEEAGREGLMGATELQKLLAGQAAILDRFLQVVSEEHTRESEALLVSSEQRKARRIERLLDGEMVDTSAIAYEFEGWHLGVVAAGPGAAEALRGLATALDRNLLLVHRDADSAWVWLGGRRALEFEQIEQVVAQRWPTEVVLAIGEPGEGLAGWRLSHQQAQAALTIAVRGTRTLTRYVDVALLASVHQDDLLVTSLRQLYLEPLEQERDGGKVSRETLWAYFAAGRNVSSAAAILGVDRRTISNRIRAVEECLNRPLDNCAVDIQVALRLDEKP